MYSIPIESAHRLYLRDMTLEAFFDDMLTHKSSTLRFLFNQCTLYLGLCRASYFIVFLRIVDQYRWRFL